MYDAQQIADFAADQRIPALTTPPPLSKQPAPDFIQPGDREEAQKFLLYVRHRINGKIDPSKSLKAKLGLRKDGAIEKINNTFTLEERRDAFNDLLQRRDPVGVAQAVIDFHPEHRFDVNVREDQSTKGSRIGRTAAVTNIIASRWLQIATETDQEDYVRLLASRKPAQNSLDESLKSAIRQSSVPITTELLRYGANSNTCHQEFHARVAKGDMEWTPLLLNSRHHVIDQVERDKALLTAVENGNFDMACLLLSFGADANYSSGSPIISSIQNPNFRMLTLLISASSAVRRESLQPAIDYACASTNLPVAIRNDAIDILLSAGGAIPPFILVEVLDFAVLGKNSNLVSLLVKHQQISPANATKAMSQFSSELSEDEALRMSRLLLKAGAEANTLGALLYWAVRKDYHRMIALLVQSGTSLDFQNAIAVQFALQQQDIRLLTLLLNGGRSASGTNSGNSNSTDTILAITLPLALNVGSKTQRHEAIRLLLQKGVKGPQVDEALLRVVTTPALCDDYVVQMLLDGGASVNFHKDGKNCVLSAAKDGNLAMLNLLSASKWGALPRILSGAVQRVYQYRAKSTRSDVMDTLTLLLQRGAECNSDLVAQTLLVAIRAAADGACAVIVELLLQHGANVNYQDGESIKEALKLAHNGVFTAICKTKSITQDSFAHALPLAIEASRGDQSRLVTLLQSCRGYWTITSDALIAEVGGSSSGGQIEVINLLLSNGANVNHREGAVFAKAIELQPLSKSVEVLRLLLSGRPDKTAAHTAFNSARNVHCPLDHRLGLFKLILEAGYDGKSIHPALAENIIANKDDITIPRLLLQHGASVDHEEGLALATATESGNTQLVDTLLAYHPGSAAVDRAFKVTCHARVSDPCRIQLYQSLLDSRTVSKHCITYALAEAITHGSRDKILLGLLARQEPSIEIEMLLSLINRRDVATTRFLLNLQVPDQKARSHAFRCCFDLERATRLAFAELLVVHSLESDVWTAALYKSIQDQDIRLLSLLLKHDPDKRLEIDETLVRAADTMNPAVIQILLSFGPSSRAIDLAFETMLSSNRMRSSPDSILAATSLLNCGVSQNLKDLALIQSVECYPHDHSDFYLVLIRLEADVNADSAACFRHAGQFENLDIFNLLLQSTAKFDIVIKSLISDFPEDKYERLLELVFVVLKSPQYQSGPPDVEVIFEAMRRYKLGDGLVRLLLDHGFPAGQTLCCGDGSSMNAEAVTPVIWALGQARPGISDDVILTLLKEEQRAQPGFTTEGSETTAISLAARFGRHTILERLLELKVDVSAVDSSGRSPLFYAAANADTMSVYLLLENGAQCNDGSLHEAARLCQKGIVALLLERNHDPDYSCDLHDGRTALGELSFQAILITGEQISAAIETMKMLVNAPTNLGFRTRGKTILHLALENDRPFEVTKALLRFPEIYKDICTHSETFVYEDAQGRFMSPDVYAKLYCKGKDIQSQLVHLLEKKGCMTKWFRKRGDQLADCRGLPPALKEEMDRQDIADQAEQREIQRRLTSAKIDLEIKQQHHLANMSQSKEQADLHMRNTQRANDQQMAHDNALSTQRRNNANAERSDERWHIQERNKLEFNAAKDISQLEYSSQKQLKQLEYSAQMEKDQQRHAAMEREAGLERKLLESREAAEKRSQSRAMERFARQDQSVMLAAKEQRAFIAAAREARVSAQASQLAIPWDQPD